MTTTATSRVWLITGGSQGIGKAACELLRERGDKVVTCSRYSQNCNGDCRCARVNHYQEATNLIEYAIEKHGRIDVLVNNAGVYKRSDVADTNIYDWEGILSVNLHGAFYMCHGAVPEMKKQGSGTIINVTSYVAKFLPAGRAAYNCSKLALLGLTVTLAREVRQHGIRVNAWSPWKTATRMDVDGTATRTAEESARQLLALAGSDVTGKFVIADEEQPEWINPPNLEDIPVE